VDGNNIVRRDDSWKIMVCQKKKKLLS
jgi:hypothetical protein